MQKRNFMERHFLSDAEAHARMVQRGHLRSAAVLARLTSVADALAGAWFRVGAFLSPAAFAQRGRDRERRKLVCELEGLDKQARYDKGRRPMLTERLQILTREDMAATLAECKKLVTPGAEGFAYQPGDVARGPQGNFYFCSSDRDALKPEVGNRRYFVFDAVEEVVRTTGLRAKMDAGVKQAAEQLSASHGQFLKTAIDDRTAEVRAWALESLKACGTPRSKFPEHVLRNVAQANAKAGGNGKGWTVEDYMAGFRAAGVVSW